MEKYQPLQCRVQGKPSLVIEDQNTVQEFWRKLKDLYHSSTAAGDYAAQYWANVAVNSDHPAAPLAHIPGVFAALWTPDVAPKTAITLGTAGYGFIGLPKNIVHFTSVAGANGIRTSGVIRSTKIGLFGPGVYTANVGRPLNLFIPKTSLTPIYLPTPAGTVRIIPKLVYVRWGVHVHKVVK